MMLSGHDRPILKNSLVRRIVGVLAAAALALAALGCPKERPAPPAAGNAPASSTAPAGRKLQIAVVPKGTKASFWQTVKAGAEQAGKEMNADIIFQGPTEETDITGQKAIL